MRAHIRRFLLSLLVLALPLQGMAAAATLECVFGVQASAGMAEAMPGCHEPEQPDHPPAQHDCTDCAACMLATAVPAPAIEGLAAISTGDGFPLAPAAAFSGFIPDAPERPPRSGLA